MSEKHSAGVAKRHLSNRFLLWSGFIAVLIGLLAAALTLSKRLQTEFGQKKLDTETALMAIDVKRSIEQTNRLIWAIAQQQVQSEGAHELMPFFLKNHPTLWTVEQFDASLTALNKGWHDHEYSPAVAPAIEQRRLNRHKLCRNALKSQTAVHGQSYAWPTQTQQNMHFMDVCQAVIVNHTHAGYVIATYALEHILREHVELTTHKGRHATFVDAHGNPLIQNPVPMAATSLSASVHPIELTGATMNLSLHQSASEQADARQFLTLPVMTLLMLMLLVTCILVWDIYLRFRAEDRLADALAFRQAMENSLATGLCACDMQGVVTHVNAAFCEMVGLTEPAILGRQSEALYWPQFATESQCKNGSDSLSAKLNGQFETSFVHQTRGGFPVRLIETPLLNASSEQTGWMMTVLDLTEQNRLEVISKDSQDRLQATARLVTVGEMASLLSHELNQPLAAIASYAAGTLNLLNAPHQTIPPELAKRWADISGAVEQISKQAERAGKVIRSVASFVRQRGRDAQASRTREMVSAKDLFEVIMPLMQLQARKQHIAIKTVIDEDCPEAYCDRVMVEQVLLNLGRNGILAMSSSSADDLSMPTHLMPDTSTLELTMTATQTQYDGKKWIKFLVQDAGIGLSEDVKAKLFRPFFTTRSEGMGLGLSLCRSVVEEHGGQLVYESVQPCGTVFWFTLPTQAPVEAT